MAKQFHQLLNERGGFFPFFRGASEKSEPAYKAYKKKGKFDSPSSLLFVARYFDVCAVLGITRPDFHSSQNACAKDQKLLTRHTRLITEYLRSATHSHPHVPLTRARSRILIKID